MVREALVTSQMWSGSPEPAGPPLLLEVLVSRNTSHESMVPNASSPASARSRAPGTLSRIHRTLGPEKYVEIGSPVISRTRSSPPEIVSARRSQISPVRTSCQTIAL